MLRCNLILRRYVDVLGKQSIYFGPLNPSIRRMKLFSIASCVLSSAMTPACLVLMAPTWPLAAKIAVCGSTMGTSLGTTFLFHWLIKRYVLEAYRLPAPQDTPIGDVQLEFVTYDFWGRRASAVYRVKDLEFIGDAFKTLRARPDGRTFLMRLLPGDLTADMGQMLEHIKTNKTPK